MKNSIAAAVGGGGGKVMGGGGNFKRKYVFPRLIQEVQVNEKVNDRVIE
jgi:hypothetical protein